MSDDRDRTWMVAEAIWRADENAHEAGWFEVNERWRDHYWRLADAALKAVAVSDPGVVS